jgi:L-serine kinase (ADP)
MTSAPEFRLLPLADLREHEEIDRADADQLAKRLHDAGQLVDPLWVAAGSFVILNGHHRAAALRTLGADRAPAWVVDYDSDAVRLERWSDGPPITKEEVLRRAEEHRLFPPKTTRHVLRIDLPPRVTQLADLMPRPDHTAGAGQPRASGRSRSSGAGSSGSS